MRWLLALALLSSVASAETVTGTPRIVDGDTIEVAGETVRLHGIDAPESSQPFGRTAISALAAMIEGREVRCEGDSVDLYRRLIATCYAGSTDIEAEMVASGNAWAFVKYSRAYVAQENAARAAHLGLWSDLNKPPQPPWEYRAERWRVAGQAAPNGCAIKGNISRHGEKIYHPPWSPAYSKTAVDESKGERWFCSEADAIKAGWRAPYWR